MGESKRFEVLISDSPDGGEPVLSFTVPGEDAAAVLRALRLSTIQDVFREAADEHFHRIEAAVRSAATELVASRSPSTGRKLSGTHNDDLNEGMSAVAATSSDSVTEEHGYDSRGGVADIAVALTAAEVAKQLKVARSTVDAIPAHELPFFSPGEGTKRQHRRYRREDVNAYVANRCAETTERSLEKEQREQWDRAASTGGRGAKTGTSTSTTRVRGVATASRRTQPTKTSLANAWLKLKGS